MVLAVLHLPVPKPSPIMRALNHTMQWNISVRHLKIFPHCQLAGREPSLQMFVLTHHALAIQLIIDLMWLPILLEWCPCAGVAVTKVWKW